MPESVIGIIEVKSKLTHNSLSRRKLSNARVEPSTIDKCNNNGTIIGNVEIFNGIFSYETDINIIPKLASYNVGKQLKEKNGYLNHICFDQNTFMRYWANGNPIDQMHNDSRPSYSFYNLSSKNILHLHNNEDKGLAFGYFIANLLEVVYRFVAPHVLNDQYFEFLYPLENTKEKYRICGCDIKVDL